MKDDFRYSQDQEAEHREWVDALEDFIANSTPERVRYLLRLLQTRAFAHGVRVPFSANTPYVNTIPPEEQPVYPGVVDLERRIRSVIRWNAMAMVVRANRMEEGIGGHISTYASAASMYEVGFNHFFRGKDHPSGGDFVYFQGHASPGIYARAFLEGRISQAQLENFRRENAKGGGLSSYPHPRLMPDFWEFPTVSMGLGPITAIYHARFIRYMEDRGLKEPTGQKVWAFIGDGESDEPETLGAISLAAREKLDNLIFVINCNLQRLDGPVRGNGKIIQELEAIFRGAGWRVLKLIWGSDWDALLDKDDDDILVTRMNEVVDGEYQKYVVESGAYIREHFFGKNPELLAMAKRLTDEQLRTLRRGGHDSIKIHAAYNHAVNHRGSPTVILVKTIKGYGMGESGEGKNITHQQKKLNEDELREFRTRFGIPIDDDDVAFAPFYLPPKDSKEMQYLRERRAALGGPLPERRVRAKPLATPTALFDEFKEGTGERAVSTTMAMVRVITKLLSDKTVGKFIVPIVPDEARTFGMEALFRQVGIYSHVGQLYEPVDADNLLYYKEAADGQIIEEGITEAGSMSSFIAAGTAYANHGVNTIPFFIYYSMFGMQRIGDLVWLAGDARCKGFLVGGTSGRTTLNGEGLQHQDGHSLVIANTVPSLVVYDPAFAFEIGVIVRDGLRRMYERGEEIFYYVTVENENYPQPKMPEGVEEGILKGLYKYRSSQVASAKPRAHLFGSGAIMNEALKAQEILGSKYGVAADVWSVTSYSQLNREAAACDRWNLLHPEAPRLVPYVTKRFADESGVIVAASDYMKVLPQSISKWLPLPMTALGTDGYGRSESRETLREYFEVDARFITLAALTALAEKGEIPTSTLVAAIKDLDIDAAKLDPMSV